MKCFVHFQTYQSHCAISTAYIVVKLNESSKNQTKDNKKTVNGTSEIQGLSSFCQMILPDQ